MTQALRFLRLRDVIDMTKLSKTTIYRKIGQQAFPRPLALTSACVRWREADIQAWMNSFEPTAQAQTAD